MATITSHSPEQTAALGEKWGREAQPGMILGLSGELGAGKTQLVKGLARGLGVAQRIHSPTFALLNEYRGGRLSLYHLDLYRLETVAQIVGAGLEVYFFQRDGVTVVEWIDRWLDLQPEAVRGLRFKRVRISAIGENERQIDYE